jgi:hypothetical protein
MSEIAFNRRDGRATRILAAMLLVAAGLMAGLGLARLAPVADIGATAPQQGASESLSGNSGFQVERPVRHVGDAGP